jgi:soluble lytic murein transglycosylase-like protein
MTLVKPAALAALTLAIATPAFAQTPAAQSAMTQPSGGSPLANDGPYAGTSRQDFYQPADRISHIQAAIQQGALAGASAHRAMAQLTAIRQDLKYRMARHNGDLLDWDRELINQKLDALVKQYPALRT